MPFVLFLLAVVVANIVFVADDITNVFLLLMLLPWWLMLLPLVWMGWCFCPMLLADVIANVFVCGRCYDHCFYGWCYCHGGWWYCHLCEWVDVFCCLPELTSLDSKKWADLSGGPCSLDSAVLSVSRLHSCILYTLCPWCEFHFCCCHQKFLFSLMLIVAKPVSEGLNFDFVNILLYLNCLDFVHSYSICLIITCIRGIPNSMGWIMLTS